jgi:hypothetical protein
MILLNTKSSLKINTIRGNFKECCALVTTAGIDEGVELRMIGCLVETQGHIQSHTVSSKTGCKTCPQVQKD